MQNAGRESMSGKWIVVALVVTTLMNAGIFLGQVSTSANARSAAAGKLLDDDDFTAGLTKLIRKTVRDYCSVGKKEHIDC
jgi:hypothetical protein